MSNYEYGKYLEDFSKTGLMLHEPIMLFKIGEGSPCGNLRYKPLKIISVMNSSLTQTYVEGVDYIINGTTISAVNGSGMSFITDDVYNVRNTDDNLSFQKAKDNVSLILFTNTPFIIEHQIAVTYEFAKEDCNVIFEKFDEKKLANTVRSLSEHKKIKMVLYGDSISCGFNSSSFMNVEPFLPIWGELLKWQLEKYYDTEIDFVNVSVEGIGSEWGVENAREQVAVNNPDLTIIAFGMNDGTARVQPEDFKVNIKKIIDIAGRGEFILVSPMLPNPDSAFVGYQEDYYAVLMQLETADIKAVNMADIHKELLVNKKHIDYSGNNINHPNDFLARCYAINILQTLIK